MGGVGSASGKRENGVVDSLGSQRDSLERPRGPGFIECTSPREYRYRRPPCTALEVAKCDLEASDPTQCLCETRKRDEATRRPPCLE
jgi:hypothetical protein